MTTVLSGKPTFGAGRAFMTGNYANPTPARLPVPQSQSIDFKRKVESLFGEKQLAVAVGAGTMEVTGKVEYAKTSARIYADIMFGDGSTTGNYTEADGEKATVPATTTFIVTVANAATFKMDLGVVNADTGAIYSRVGSGSETAGSSYSLDDATGVYTFDAGDASANVKISYVYSVVDVGATIVLSNQDQGLTGNFRATHVLPWGTEQDMYVFNNCIASSSGVSLKNSGFGMTTIDYTAGVDGNDELGTATFAEAA